MSVRITTLVENSTDKMGLLAEHGLSLLIEAHGLRMLFDTGQTGIVAHNARALGLDLASVDMIALSHGHADHTGGLLSALREVCRGQREVRVAGHQDVFAPHFSVRKDERPHYAGIPFSRIALEGVGAAFSLSMGPVEIGDGIWLTGEVPQRSSFESVAKTLVLRDGDGWHQDPLSDDQALVIKTGSGLVVALGCAHRGMVNTLEYAREITGEERVFAVLGGTHLGPAPREQLEESIRALRTLGVQKVGVSHCTGLKAGARLSQEFGDAFFFNVAGTVTELP
jgi:7,8-dihydropterin-6-yl-methyl-4-(beta-D-ribofuranosyl)aminobenzene 5'-phosphate synthase